MLPFLTGAGVARAVDAGCWLWDTPLTTAACGAATAFPASCLQVIYLISAPTRNVTAIARITCCDDFIDNQIFRRR